MSFRSGLDDDRRRRWRLLKAPQIVSDCNEQNQEGGQCEHPLPIEFGFAFDRLSPDLGDQLLDSLLRDVQDLGEVVGGGLGVGLMLFGRPQGNDLSSFFGRDPCARLRWLSEFQSGHGNSIVRHYYGIAMRVSGWARVFSPNEVIGGKAFADVMRLAVA